MRGPHALAHVLLAGILVTVPSAFSSTIAVFLKARPSQQPSPKPNADLCVAPQLCAMPAGTGYDVLGSLSVRDILTSGSITTMRAWLGNSAASVRIENGYVVADESFIMRDLVGFTYEYPVRTFSEYASGEGRVLVNIDGLETDASGVRVLTFTEPFLMIANTDAAARGGYEAYPTTYYGSQDEVMWDRTASTPAQIVLRTRSGRSARFGILLTVVKRREEATKDSRYFAPAVR